MKKKTKMKLNTMLTTFQVNTVVVVPKEYGKSASFTNPYFAWRASL